MDVVIVHLNVLHLRMKGGVLCILDVAHVVQKDFDWSFDGDTKILAGSL